MMGVQYRTPIFARCFELQFIGSLNYRVILSERRDTAAGGVQVSNRRSRLLASRSRRLPQQLCAVFWRFSP